MQTSHLYTDFELTVKKLSPNNSPRHRHSYFEIIYVLRGSGIHIINDNKFLYSDGDLFLLTPDDTHSLQTKISSAFCIIDFTKSFFGGQNRAKGCYTDNELQLFEKLEYIFHNYNRRPGNVAFEKNDKLFLKELIDRLIWEKENNLFGHENIFSDIIFLLLHLIERYMREHLIFPLASKRSQNTIHEIVNYIHYNIYDKDKVTVKNIGEVFHKSPDHISNYFKQQTGITLKDYITNYKLELIKNRLLYSDLTVSEIATEFVFTDESHLNKTFKKNFRMSANAFRKMKREK